MTTQNTPVPSIRSLVPPLAAAVGIGALGGLACETASSLPGTSYGDYAVEGALTTNTCGTDSEDPWDFTVELSRDGQKLYMADEHGKLSGTFESSKSTAVTLTSSTTSNVDGTEAGAGSCNLTRTRTYALTLGSESPPAGFTGTVTYTFAVASGISTSVDCTNQLRSSGGTFETLPCTIAYSLKADRD